MSKPKVVLKEKSARKNIIFKLITGLIPVLILLVAEGSLRLIGYGDNFDLFIKNPTEGYENYLMVNPEIGKKYFQKVEYTAPANDIFLADKPGNTFRIFVMGSSTVYGFPYERNLMFSRILHQQLEEAYPNKKIEVVNTSITAINSFTLLDFAGQIVKCKPDAILIYAGHNEFYGAFGIGSNETMSRNRDLTRLHIALLDFRIYQLIRNGISGVSQKIAINKKDAVHGTLMKRMVADKDILLNSEEYTVAMDGYRQNMGEILQLFRDKNIPVFLSEVVSNCKDLEPFNSVSAEGLEAAMDVYKEAQSAESSGEFEKAWELYCKAKDLDCIRFRASEEVNQIIHELAKKHHAKTVSMVSWFRKNSQNGLIGNSLMTEHVHPNIDGNFLMASAFYTEILQSELIDKINHDPGYSVQYRKLNYGFSDLDSLLARHRVQLLKGHWPFVKNIEDEVNYLLQYRPVSYPDSLTFAVLQNKQQSLADARFELAKKYEKEGKFYQAFKEYDALVRTNPYIAINYRDAANCLLQLTDLPLALKYFQKSLEFEESGFANFKIGEIYFFMGDYNNALASFEKSFPLMPDESKLLVLVKSYISCVYGNNTEKAKLIAAELKKLNAGQYLNVPPKTYAYNQSVPYQIRTQINTAKQLVQENKYDEALAVLESSLQIYDSRIANRLIGEIHILTQNFDEALLFYKKVYDQYRFDPRFLNKLAIIYLEKKDVTNAKKCLDEIIAIDPGYENISQLSLLLASTN